MNRLEQMTVWLASLFGVVALACLAVFILFRPDAGDLLFGAVITGAASAVSLLVGVCSVTFISVNVRRRRSILRTHDVSLIEQFRQRQAVLERRLQFDELRFCTQAKAPCAAWSLCGASGEPQAGETPAADLSGNDQSLPLVVRQTMALSCLALPLDTKDGDIAPDAPARGER